MRLKIFGLSDETSVGNLKRSMNLVIGVTGVKIDADKGEVIVFGDPAETLLLVHLANDGFEAEIIGDTVQHPQH